MVFADYQTSVTANDITADSNNVPSDGIPSLSYDSTGNRITPNGSVTIPQNSTHLRVEFPV